MPYVKGAVFKRLYNVSDATLRTWADHGKIDSCRTPGGIRLYKLPDDSQLTKLSNKDSGARVVYVRVSSPKQKDDLERQKAFMHSRFPAHEIVADVGSGINWRRKGLLSLLDRANKGGLNQVVVASRDRLCRFAFELLEYIFKQRGVQLIVLESNDASPEDELSDDLLSVVQVFCCRRNGKRRYGGHKDAKNQVEPDKRAKNGDAKVCSSGEVHV